MAATASTGPALDDGGVDASREVYHTKRMQKLFSVRWSADAKYIVTGSDETNIRCADLFRLF